MWQALKLILGKLRNVWVEDSIEAWTVIGVHIQSLPVYFLSEVTYQKKSSFFIYRPFFNHFTAALKYALSVV